MSDETPYVVGRIELGGIYEPFPPLEMAKPISIEQIKREAFAAGVRAMREAAATHFEDLTKASRVQWHQRHAAAVEIRFLPDPEPSE